MDQKITVLMAVYNSETYLREAIESILRQTFRGFEFLILNDGSTDASKEIILSYSDPRIRYVENETNLGLTKSLNVGLKLASGEYVARMDADDWSFPERLERQVCHLDENRETILVTGNCEVIDAEGRLRNKVSISDFSPETIYYRLTFHNSFPHSSVMFRKKEIIELGAYDEKLKRAQDFDLWFRISRKYRIFALDDFLIRLREHAENISHKNEGEQSSQAFDIFARNIREVLRDEKYPVENVALFHREGCAAWNLAKLNLKQLLAIMKIQGQLVNNAPSCIDKRSLRVYCWKKQMKHLKKWLF